MSSDGRLTAAELRELAADDVMDDVNGLRWDKDRLLGEVYRLRKLIVESMVDPHSPIGETEVEAEAHAIREEGG